MPYIIYDILDNLGLEIHKSELKHNHLSTIWDPKDYINNCDMNKPN